MKTRISFHSAIALILITLIALSMPANHAQASAQALSPRFLYVANFGSNNVSAFVINADTGNLVAVPGSPFAAGANPHGVTTDPDGKFAFISNFRAIQSRHMSLMALRVCSRKS